ncbi:MAG TPA: hypothetical protein V6D08_16360, partial [Candidatus Obscuribacterales bacterium]
MGLENRRDEQDNPQRDAYGVKPSRVKPAGTRGNTVLRDSLRHDRTAGVEGESLPPGERTSIGAIDVKRRTLLLQQPLLFYSISHLLKRYATCQEESRSIHILVFYCSQT